MANMKKKMMKNIKEKNKKEKKKYPIKDEISTISLIIIIMAVIAIITIMVTNIAKGDYSIFSSKVKISETEIIAGQVFNRSDKEYYVVFYDNDDIKDVIEELDTDKKIYTVDLLSAFNKNIISGNVDLTKSNIDELKVYSTSLIKIVDGINTEHIEGYSNVEEYLNNFKEDK